MRLLPKLRLPKNTWMGLLCTWNARTVPESKEYVRFGAMDTSRALCADNVHNFSKHKTENTASNNPLHAEWACRERPLR